MAEPVKDDVKAAAEDATSEVKVPDVPKPVQIIKMTGANTFDLVEENLRQVLLGPKVAKLPVVVVSIAGPFRLGKSFMLNYFYQYLRTTNGNEDVAWEPQTNNQDGTGFHWAHGADRDTTGVWMLDTPIVRTVNGKSIAVLLVDTQGTFDNKTTNQMNSVVFALNSLLSSIQVYNISKRIGEDILQHMHMFTKFGQMACDKQESADGHKTKPFQKLMFLIRDWGGKNDYSFGHDGGNKYLQDVLQTNDDKAQIELKEVRRDIQKCFQELECFLMPHPGLEVAEGDSGEVEPRFAEYLTQFVPLILKNSNLVVKKMLAEEMSCKMLFDYVKTYVNIFKDKNGELPEVTSVFDATAKLNHQNLMYSALELYSKTMNSYAGAKAPYRDPEVLEIKHKETMATCVSTYGDTPRLSSERIEAEARTALKEKIEAKYSEICASNESKALLTVLKTPITCCGLALSSNIIGTFLGLIGMASLANLMSYLTWISLLTIAFWSYSTHSGNFGDVTKEIDEYAKIIYDVVRAYVLQYAMGEGLIQPSKKTN